MSIAAWQEPPYFGNHLRFGLADGRVYCGELIRHSKDRNRAVIKYNPDYAVGLWKLNNTDANGTRTIEIVFNTGKTENITDYTVTNDHAFNVGSAKYSGRQRFKTIECNP